MNKIQAVDSHWTLFLDRDGVINVEKKGNYILSVSEFKFYEDALESIKKLAIIFGKIIIVTNQRGIGRGMMTHADLRSIHNYMLDEISKAGGRIDKIYYAPENDENSIDRKPNIGMGIKAKKDFPEIEFAKSIMVGNNLSDMKFGKGLNMISVYIETTKTIDELNEYIDIKTENLSGFCKLLGLS